MLRKLLSIFSGRPAPAPAIEPAQAERKDFERLNAVAPVVPVGPGETGADAEMARSFLCREAVLNAEQRVVGYEFQLRRGARDRFRGKSRLIHHVYNEVVVRSIVQYSVRKLLGQRLAFVPLLDSFLDHAIVRELPPQGVVLTIEQGPDDGPDPDAVAAQVRLLKQAGFAVAIEECFAGPHFAALAPLVDYFVVDTAAHEPAETKILAGRLPQANARAVLVAKGLRSYEDFVLCRKLGFGRFSGPFVTRREDWTANEVGPEGLRVCDLLNRLRRDAEAAELAPILRQDAMLSYRLMRYVNCASCGLARQVTSVEDALMIMGRAQLYRWLTLLLFGSAQKTPGAEALLENALARGRMMELAATESMKSADRDALFVTGLFSLLDMVLRVPMENALAAIKLPEEIPAALLRQEGPYAPYLELALACESFDQERIAAASRRCGLDADKVNERHIEALAWAQGVEV